MKKYVPSEQGLIPVLSLSKICRECGEDKSRSDFSKGRADCKQCRREDVLSNLERRIRKHNLRAERRGIPGRLTASEWLDRIAYFNNLCGFCGSGGWQKTLEIGHIYPLSKYEEDPTHTSNDIEAVIPLCHKCNCAMSDGSLLTFIGWFYQTLDGAA